MEIKVKKLHENAKMPYRAYESSAGFDLYATTIDYDNNGNVVYGTGLAFEIPKGHVGFLFPRSSNAKKDLLLSNSVGVIDSDYRGEVTFKFKSTINTVNPIKLLWCIIKHKLFGSKNFSLKHFCIHRYEYSIGDRIGQLIIMPYPSVEYIESETLNETRRGSGGYGSSGQR